MKEENSGMLLILITVILWSTIEVSTKIVQGDIPPMMISFLRFVIGGLFLLPLSIRGIMRGDTAGTSIREWIILILLSVLGITLTFALYHKALIWISATSVATLISMVPVFAALISFIVLKERITWLQITGLLIGLIGIGLIYLSEESGSFPLLGIIVMVIAVICFSIYSVLMKRLNRKMTAKVTTPLSLLIGGILTAPIALMEGSVLIKPLDVQEILLVAWLGLFAVGIAYLLYFIGLERIKIAKGNSLLYLKPLIAGALAWIILGEAVSIGRILAIGFISVSIYFVLQDGNGFRSKKGKEE